MRCAVAKCLENNTKKSASGKFVSYYTFPKDIAQRRLWETFCNREETINFKYERICALHFKQDDFVRNLRFEMGCSNRSTPKLKPGAVPTIEPSVIASGIERTCDEKNTLMMTDEDKVQLKKLNKDEIIDGQQLYMKTLQTKIDALRQENDMLKIKQIQSADTIQNLSSDVQNLILTIANLEKSLRCIFTQGQIKKLKAGNRRQNFTKEDIVRSRTLYAASSKAYRFLRKNHFPLPSVRTLQRWSQKFDA